MLSPSLRYQAFTGIEWSFQMKDLGFDEEGELEGSNDPEMSSPSKESSIEMGAKGSAVYPTMEM